MTIEDQNDTGPTTTPLTPSQQVIKRTRRQSKITDVFSVGRRSVRPATITKELNLTESPIRVRKKVTTLNLPIRKALKEPLEASATPAEPLNSKSPQEDHNLTSTAVSNPLLAKAFVPPIIEPLEELKVPPPDESLNNLKDEPTNPKSEPKDSKDESKNFKDEPIPAEPIKSTIAALNLPKGLPIIDSTLVPFDAASSIIPTMPAYQRFAHLISGPRTFALPLKFTLLEKIMGALDSICMLASGRDQTVIFHKIHKALESSVGRRVEVSHLKQIQGVFLDKSLENQRRMAYKFCPMTIIFEGRRTETFTIELPEEITHDYLADRKSELFQRLIAHINKEHQMFLDNNDFKLPPGAKLRCWHPKFDLESVKDLPVSEILDPVKKLSNHHHQPKQPIPLDIAQAITTTATTLMVKDSSSPKVEKVPSPPPKHHPSSVLERVKAKQREAELAKISHDPLKDSKRQKLEILLEFSETVAILFSTVNKSSLLFGDVIAKITQGSKSSLSQNEVIERLESLSQIVPEWLKVVHSGTVKMLRIDRTCSMTMVKQRVKNTLDSL